MASFIAKHDLAASILLSLFRSHDAVKDPRQIETKKDLQLIEESDDALAFSGPESELRSLLSKLDRLHCLKQAAIDMSDRSLEERQRVQEGINENIQEI